MYCKQGKHTVQMLHSLLEKEAVEMFHAVLEKTGCKREQIESSVYTHCIMPRQIIGVITKRSLIMWQ